MQAIEKLKAVPFVQKYRYAIILISAMSFLGPLAFLPQLTGNTDLCGQLCMRRFYLYFPGMTWEDLWTHVSVAYIGVIAFTLILLTTFFFGRLWCSFLCPVGGLAELGSRMLNDRWKIEFRSLPQVQIRYGYFGVYLVLMPMLGISACTLCNFITIPRLIEALSGEYRGVVYVLSSVGLVNLGLLFILGFFAHKGRAYCQLLCPIGAADGLMNRLGARFGFTHHIRVAKERCTGCNVCARACMCGAIKMVDKVATVQQLSCMSCHDCVDVCDWNAIEWTTASRNKEPKRIKKGVTIFPEPSWASLDIMPEPVPQRNGIAGKLHWGRVINGLIVSFVIAFVATTSAIHYFSL
jgi:polyferredoxin